MSIASVTDAIVADFMKGSRKRAKKRKIPRLGHFTKRFVKEVRAEAGKAKRPLKKRTKKGKLTHAQMVGRTMRQNPGMSLGKASKFVAVHRSGRG